MTYAVEFSPTASADLETPTRSIKAIQDAWALLSPFLRELVIAFGNTCYVALFEIVNDRRIIIGDIRHQREDDYP